MVIKFDNETVSMGNKCLLFFRTAGKARKFVCESISRVVIEGSRGLGKRLEGQDGGVL